MIYRDEAIEKRIFLLFCFLIFVITIQSFITTGKTDESNLTPIELLGKNLFFETNLSTPLGQSCAACHDPETGFSGGNSDINAHGSVYEGAFENRFTVTLLQQLMRVKVQFFNIMKHNFCG
jgi:cytochrome c peroxidase